MSENDDGRPARVALGPGSDYTVCRIINGGWQLAAGHSASQPDRLGQDDLEATVPLMHRLVESGLTTFDCADIYTGVEERIGAFLASWRRLHGAGALDEVQVHTKCVPDREALPSLKRSEVEALVDRSLRRLDLERLDLVQLHWWDLRQGSYVDAAGWLQDLCDRGKVRLVGATNFGLPQLAEIVEAGIEIASHQVQVSLLDRRALGAMSDYCRERGIALLAYGSLAGGLLTDAWRGRPDPGLPGAEQSFHENRSLSKYRLIVEEAGGWERFEDLLADLAALAREIAEETTEDVSVAQLALRWVLDRPAVGAAIVGTRSARHLASNLAVLGVELDPHHLRRLDHLAAELPRVPGEVYQLEREPGGRHGAIMKTDLNRMR